MSSCACLQKKRFVRDPFVPKPPTDPCCIWPKCQKLHVIVLCLDPWTAIPGADRTPDVTKVNQPPANSQFPVTPGLPINLRIAARPPTVARPLAAAAPAVTPTGWNKKYGVPAALYAKYGEALANAKTFLFDFGTKHTVRTGEGQLLAYGRGGAIQASLDFVYRWCGSQKCAGVTLPPLEITGCTSINAKFVVLGNIEDFLQTEPDASLCSESFVVFGLQQYCCETYKDQVDGVDQVLAPYNCVKCPLPCVERRILGACIPAS